VKLARNVAILFAFCAIWALLLYVASAGAEPQVTFHPKGEEVKTAATQPAKPMAIYHCEVILRTYWTDGQITESKLHSAAPAALPENLKPK
jgi:hypothetical protein